MSNYLVHYGIPGQEKGVRRFQNEDGSLTPAGKLRYYGDSVTRGTTETSTNVPHSRVKTVGSGSVTATAGKTGYSDTENPVSGSSNPAWQAQMALKLKGQNGIQSVYFKPGDRNTYVIGPDGKEHRWDYANNKIEGSEVPHSNTMNQYLGTHDTNNNSQPSGYRVQSMEESKKREQAREAYESRIRPAEAKVSQPDSTTENSLSSKIKSSVTAVKNKVANLLSKIGKIKF